MTERAKREGKAHINPERQDSDRHYGPARVRSAYAPGWEKKNKS